MNKKHYTFLLADDHPLFRKGVRTLLLSLQLDLPLRILESSNGIETIEISRGIEVDLFILDFKMPGLNGFETSKKILQRNPKANIIILTMYDDLPIIVNSLTLGVKGFLTKNTSADEIETAVKQVIAGFTYYNDSIEKRLRQYGDAESAVRFTERETELVSLLSDGHSSKQIAEKLGLTLKTIETYRSRMLEKVNVKNTAELLSYFQRNGLLH